jgi:hypothetical protein
MCWVPNFSGSVKDAQYIFVMFAPAHNFPTYSLNLQKNRLFVETNKINEQHIISAAAIFID